MKTIKAEFTFDNMPCIAIAENGSIAWISLDGFVGPVSQWSLELRLAAIEALKLLD